MLFLWVPRRDLWGNKEDSEVLAITGNVLVLALGASHISVFTL